MNGEHTLESTLQELRSKERAETLPRVDFNQFHRQFLDAMRHGGWVRSSQFPDTPKMKLTLLRRGWIEQRDAPAGTEFRATAAGLAELCRPR